jgi:hypothetical protein
VYHESSDIAAISEGATLTTLLLAAEHLLLWGMRDRMHITARYTLGTAAIGAGLTWSALRRKDYAGAAAFWTIAGCGGALVVSAHWLRSLRGHPADRIIRRALGGNDGLWRAAP